MYQAFITTIQNSANLNDIELMNLFGFIQDNVKFLLSEDGDMSPYLEDFQAIQEAQSLEGMARAIESVNGGDYNSLDCDGLGFTEVIYDESTGREIDVDVAAFAYEVIHGLKEA